MEREDLKKKVDLAFLSAFYGGMLTDHQRRILSLHCTIYSVRYRHSTAFKVRCID